MRASTAAPRDLHGGAHTADPVVELSVESELYHAHRPLDRVAFQVTGSLPIPTLEALAQHGLYVGTEAQTPDHLLGDLAMGRCDVFRQLRQVHHCTRRKNDPPTGWPSATHTANQSDK